jgi:hypothetical protein
MKTFHAVGEKWPQIDTGARARLEDLIGADADEMSNECEKIDWKKVIAKIQELEGFEFLRPKVTSKSAVK